MGEGGGGGVTEVNYKHDLVVLKNEIFTNLPFTSYLVDEHDSETNAKNTLVIIFNLTTA